MPKSELIVNSSRNLTNAIRPEELNKQKNQNQNQKPCKYKYILKKETTKMPSCARNIIILPEISTESTEKYTIRSNYKNQ